MGLHDVAFVVGVTVATALFEQALQKRSGGSEEAEMLTRRTERDAALREYQQCGVSWYGAGGARLGVARDGAARPRSRHATPSSPCRPSQWKR